MRRIVRATRHAMQRMERRHITLMEAEHVLNNYHTEFPSLKGTTTMWGDLAGRRLVIWVLPLGDGDSYELQSVADRDEEE